MLRSGRTSGVTRTLGALWLAVLAFGPAQAVAGTWLKPTSAVEGSVRLSWAWTSGVAGALATTSEGSIRFDVRDRAPGTSALLGWVPGEFPSWATEPQRVPGFFLRAQAQVERFRETRTEQCGDGTPAVRTVALTGAGPANALLMTDEPDVDAVRRTGRIDIDPPFLVHRDGVYRLGQAVLGTGVFSVRETGAQCEYNDAEVPITTPRPMVDAARAETGAGLMGFDALVALTDGIDDIRLTVTTGGGLRIQRTATANVTAAGGATGKVTMEVDLRVAGPLDAHSALCRVITRGEAARLRNAAEAQRLARRRGFTRVAIGRAMTAVPGDRARYVMRWGGSSAPCGAALGTRKSPALFPVRRAAR